MVEGVGSIKGLGLEIMGRVGKTLLSRLTRFHVSISGYQDLKLKVGNHAL